MLPLEWFLAVATLPSLLICAFLGVPHLTGQQPLGRTSRRILAYAAGVLVFSVEMWVMDGLSVPAATAFALATLIPVIVFTSLAFAAGVLHSIDPRAAQTITSFFTRKGSFNHNITAAHRASAPVLPNEEKTVA